MKADSTHKKYTEFKIRFSNSDTWLWLFSRISQQRAEIHYQGKAVWLEHWAGSFCLSCRPCLAPRLPSFCRGRLPRTPPPCSLTAPAHAGHRRELEMERRQKWGNLHMITAERQNMPVACLFGGRCGSIYTFEQFKIHILQNKPMICLFCV